VLIRGELSYLQQQSGGIDQRFLPEFNLKWSRDGLLLTETLNDELKQLIFTFGSQLQFSNYSLPAPITWAPTTGLYTDSSYLCVGGAATIVYH
jgi:hypothetical protein